MDHIAKWMDALRSSLAENTFIKISLGNYKGKEDHLRNIYVKKILIKREEKLSFTFRYQTKDVVKNYDIVEGIGHIGRYIGMDSFRVATLFTTAHDLHFEYINSGKAMLKEKPPVHTELPSLSHDKEKNRLIPAKGKHYLTSLQITDGSGTVYKAAQDKYRQINHYIEILSSLLKGLTPGEMVKVVDMGAGKGYLTFALYDYLTNTLNIKAEVTGVEYRKELVELCNKIGQEASFENLRFVQGSIEEYDASGVNVLIALHACDTATDDAIAKGIAAGAELIVVAPCCHKQIRREMEQHKTHNDLDYLLRHGIYLERQAEMATDGIRALIMEYFGYSTRIFEFVSDVHTPKNIMLTGVRNTNLPQRDPDVLNKIKQAKAYFGIGHHYLGTVTGIR